MPTIYPTNIDLIQANVDNTDIVLAEDVNLVSGGTNKAQVALGAQPVTGISDSVAYVAGALPAPNVLGGFNGVIVNYPTAGASGTQVGWASIVATQLKALIGGANYRTQPGISLATLRNEPFITNGASTPLTNETPISTVIGAGSLTLRPAAAAGNNGWLYFVNADGTAASPNGSLGRSNGATWSNVAFYQQGAAPAAGDLIYWDDTGKQWNRLALGTAGQFLGVGTGVPQWTTVTATSIGAIPASIGVADGDLLVFNSGAWARLPLGTTGQVLTNLSGSVAWAVQSGVMITTPNVYLPLSGTWIAYGSVTAAAAAAYNKAYPIVIPPGDYSSEGPITCSTNAPLVELIPGSVTLGGVIMRQPSCYVNVFKLTRTLTTEPLDDYAVVDASDCTGSIVKCNLIEGAVNTSVGNVLYGVLLRTTPGNLSVYADRIEMSEGGTDTSVAVSNSIAGCTLSLFNSRVFGATTGIKSSGGTAGIKIYGGAVSAGSGVSFNGAGISVYNVQYDLDGVQPSAYMTGDRMRSGQSSLFARSFS